MQPFFFLRFQQKSDLEKPFIKKGKPEG